MVSVAAVSLQLIHVVVTITAISKSEKKIRVILDLKTNKGHGIFNNRVFRLETYSVRSGNIV